MKNHLSCLKYAAVVICLSFAHQAFSWHYGVTNWSDRTQHVAGRYPAGCRDDNVYIGVGSRVDFDAKACILTEIALHDVAQSPYKGSVLGAYTEYHIIGPIDGVYRVGRLEHN